MNFQSLEISSIDASGRLRPINPVWVSTFAEALAEGDDLPPIEVVERGSGYRLVNGAHRLAAHVEVGLSTIDARVFAAAEYADEAAIRLREIRANMATIELTVLDRAVHIAAWKEIYETVNTVDRRGGKRRGIEPATNRQDFAIRFSAAAAEALDISERSVRIAVQIASGIVPMVRNRIALAPIAKNASELLQLSHQDGARQAAIVDLLLSEPPQAGSVADAIAVIDRIPAPTKFTGWERVSDRFSRLSPADQGRFFAAHADAIDVWMATRRTIAPRRRSA